MHSNIPKGSTVITREELYNVFSKIYGKYVVPNTNRFNVSEAFLKEKTYDLMITTLRKSRKFYPGLNNFILEEMRKQFCNGYTYAVDSSPLDVLFEEFDELSWKKVNGEDYPIIRYNELKARLINHVGS